jgi:CBS domain-containing protein
MPVVVPTGRIVASGDFLDAPVQDLMSPGVIAISERASLNEVYAALATNRIHAILVMDEDERKPLGWATADGLLGFAERDTSLLCARDAITQDPMTVEYGSTARDAIQLLSRADTTHLIVVRGGDGFPVGTISELDLAAFLAPET